MRSATKNQLCVVVCAMLLLYAAVGDFTAASVFIVTEHDCDHPWVTNHKWVAEAAGSKLFTDQLALRDIALAAAAAVSDHGKSSVVEHLHCGEAAMFGRADSSDSTGLLRC